MLSTKQQEIEALLDMMVVGFIQQNCEGVEEITVEIANAIPNHLLTENVTVRDAIDYLANKYLNKE